jgi:MFS family permease
MERRRRAQPSCLCPLGTGSRWAGRLVVRWGPRRPLVLGPSLAGIGYGVLAAFAGEASFWRGVLPGLLVVAVGMTLSVAPLTTTVFEAAPEAQGGAASGINNAAARVGGLLAIAALGLAFGAGDQALGRPAEVLGAARVVMLAALVLSALSAVTALVTIEPRRS